MKTGREILLWCLTTLIVMVLFSCANVVTPSGGPLDRTVPVVKKSEPRDFSKNFSGNKIRIYFNEFVTIDDPTQIVISPPLIEMPQYLLQGKSMLIEFADTLADSTTYTIFFGDAVKDITEGNILSAYKFVFSTGNVIDSMSINGTLINAYTLQAEKDILIFLYQKPYDSIPYKEFPSYLTRTGANGYFEVPNIRQGRYMMFALKDMNGNLLYDQPNEQIAFYDTLVVPQYIPKPDTSLDIHGTIDSVANNGIDSVAIDSVVQEEIRFVNLLLFTEEDTAQKLLKAKSDSPGSIRLVFKYPTNQLNINILNRPASRIRFLEWSSGMDSLTLWLSDAEPDTLQIELVDNGVALDTSEIIVKSRAEKKPNQSGKGISDAGLGFSFRVSSNISGSLSIDVYRPLDLTFSHPIDSADLSLIQLSQKIDTNWTLVNPSVAFTDSLLKRHLRLDYRWKEKTDYKLFLPPGTFKDVFGLSNDSLQLTFKSTSESDYGSFIFSLKISQKNVFYVVQLLSNSGTLISERYVSETEKLAFHHLLPGDYKIRIIEDKNRNKRWDSGRYLRKIKPEPIFYPGQVTIKANWDSDLEWEL